MSQDSTLEKEKDPCSQWSFQDVFKEDCIVLDPVSVLPVQYEITTCLLPISQGQKMLALIISWRISSACALCSWLVSSAALFISSHSYRYQAVPTGLLLSVTLLI